MSQPIDTTLEERGTRYGEFGGHAKITQGIKTAMYLGDNWYKLPPDMKECLEMVAHKIGRILNGDPNYIDSWHDIIGYVRLVEQRLERNEKAHAPEPDTSIYPQAASLEQYNLPANGSIFPLRRSIRTVPATWWD